MSLQNITLILRLIYLPAPYPLSLVISLLMQPFTMPCNCGQTRAVALYLQKRFWCQYVRRKLGHRPNSNSTDWCIFIWTHAQMLGAIGIAAKVMMIPLQ